MAIYIYSYVRMGIDARSRRGGAQTDGRTDIMNERKSERASSGGILIYILGAGQDEDERI